MQILVDICYEKLHAFKNFMDARFNERDSNAYIEHIKLNIYSSTVY